MTLIGIVQAEVDSVERNKPRPPRTRPSTKFRVVIKSDQLELVMLVDDPRPYVPGEHVVIHVLNEES